METASKIPERGTPVVLLVGGYRGQRAYVDSVAIPDTQGRPRVYVCAAGSHSRVPFRLDELEIVGADK